MAQYKVQYGVQHMKSMTFRLSESDIELLQRIMDARGCSKADAIRFAIQSGADAIQADSRESGGVEAAAAAIAALTRQLDAKDAQIADLAEALRGAQDTAKAAQALHAQERAALESAEQKAARRWWQIWK